MEQSLEVEPVHVYQRTWEEAVNQAEAQAVSVKYMFVAMTQQEYNAQSIDDGTLPAIQHTHHNTGFTSWHCSFHDAVALHAVVHRDSSRGIHARLLHGDVCSQCTQGSHQFDHGWGKAFNRRFLSLMYQGEPAYMFDTTEHGSQSAQDPCQLDANSRALQLYQWVHLMYCLDTAVHNLHQLPVCINIMYQQRFTNCNSSQLSVLVFQGSSAVVSSAVMSMAANVAEVAVLMAATLSLICWDPKFFTCTVNWAV